MARGSTSPPQGTSPVSSTGSVHTQEPPRKSERSHEENQERAFIAASRRADRSIEARVQSARMASIIHKRRTGRSFKISEEIVLKEDMYEEEDDDLPRLRNNATRGYGSVDISNIPPGSTAEEQRARAQREAEINDLFARHFPNVSQQYQRPQQPPQPQQHPGPVQQQSHAATDPHTAEIQQQQMYQMPQQYRNQQQQQQPAGQYYQGQPQPFASQPHQQHFSGNEPSYFHHRDSVTSFAGSNDGSGIFPMASPHAIHASMGGGHPSRSNSVATGSEMMPVLSSASSSNDTGSNSGSQPMPVDMSTLPGNFTIPATAHDTFQSSVGNRFSQAALSPPLPGLKYNSTPTGTPSVSTPASQDSCSLAAVANHSPKPHIRRESSGIVLTTYGPNRTVTPVTDPSKPIDTAAWAAAAGTAALTYPVLDPNASQQFVHGSAVSNPAVPDHMLWSMLSEDGTFPMPADPTAEMPFPLAMAMDDTVHQSMDFTSVPTSTFSSCHSVHTLVPGFSPEAMQEQFGSRIGTPDGGAGDPWNEWVHYQD
ncbi:uncharacterized protein SPSK_01564 [Sporothrix schenckii 1099-18]|uniref:Uncharacterized protein n=1 Tax=Sporothrix schenckii 1099-18 TaxID=1397361 RepID=A0A0F2MED4_SPOSC|nr:uncharacterized protein SPSK_01564 [Sporothrix schenckii 1099-18]KJR87439.1 hypothetical protein SPSK_01564 [Sporothrix schenckii 1099-18]